MADTDRIAALEARIAQLEARLAMMESSTVQYIGPARYGRIPIELPLPNLETLLFRPPPAPMMGDDSVHPSRTVDLPGVHC